MNGGERMDASGDAKPGLGMEGIDMDSLFNIDMPPSEFDPSSFASVDPAAAFMNNSNSSNIERARTTPPMMPNGHMQTPLPPQPSSAPPEPHVKLEMDDSAMQIDPAEPEGYFDPRFVPPPPPPAVKAANVDHVDVDLGPLKSVSRNHAKIEYHNELGHFCLEIIGRNGAWVDDRYFVKGSVVPLAQM
jgi:hypothetical protein